MRNRKYTRPHVVQYLPENLFKSQGSIDQCIDRKATLSDLSRVGRMIGHARCRPVFRRLAECLQAPSALALILGIVLSSSNPGGLAWSPQTRSFPSSQYYAGVRADVGHLGPLANVSKDCILQNVSLFYASRLYFDQLNDKLYLYTGNALFSYDVSSGSLRKPGIALPMGGDQGSDLMTVDSYNGFIYVADGSAGSITVVNGTSNQVITNISVPMTTTGIAFDPQNHLAYVSEIGWPNLSAVAIINTTSNSMIGNISVGSYPIGIIFDTENKLVYVDNLDSNSVSVINPTTGTVTANLPVGTKPNAMALDSRTGILYVANRESRTLSMINTHSESVVGTVSILGLSDMEVIAADVTSGELYVGGNTSLYVVNDTTQDVTALPFTFYSLLLSIALDEKDSLLFAVSQSDNFYLVSTTGTCSGIGLPSSPQWFAVTVPVVGLITDTLFESRLST